MPSRRTSASGRSKRYTSIPITDTPATLWTASTTRVTIINLSFTPVPGQKCVVYGLQEASTRARQMPEATVSQIP